MIFNILNDFPDLLGTSTYKRNQTLFLETVFQLIVDDSGRFGCTVYDVNNLVLLTLPSAHVKTSSNVTILGKIEKIVIATDAGNKFIGTILIEEDGINVEQEFFCLDCRQGDNDLNLFSIDTGGTKADCLGMCVFNRRKYKKCWFNI